VRSADRVSVSAGSKPAFRAGSDDREADNDRGDRHADDRAGADGDRAPPAESGQQAGKYKRDDAGDHEMRPTLTTVGRAGGRARSVL